jgi:hypothetical protein
VALCRDADVVTPSAYDTTHPYYFYAFDHYATDGSSSVAALTIRTNGNIYLTNASGEDSVKYAGRTLNRDTRNYAISFIKADFKIEATDLIVQPGINQGKEYAGSPYNDPLWQLVVYGETITYDTDAWVSNIEIDESSFSGYTANIAVENNSNYSITCSFIGSQTEVINATFNGTINTYDTSEENQVTIIEYSDSANEIIEIEEEPTLNHIKITLSHNDTIITFVARTPKSITSLPFGSYYLSDNVIAYTLVPNRCQMLIADKTTTITTASLQIKENECYGSFTDSEGNKYLVKKQDNIRKQQIKSFVY